MVAVRRGFRPKVRCSRARKGVRMRTEIITIPGRSRLYCVDTAASDGRVSVSLATDVGGIELMHACFDGRGVPPHIHDEYSISIPLRGGLGFDFQGSRHLAPSRVISCIAPGEVHNAYAAE